jgi:hypothetical protein
MGNKLDKLVVSQEQAEAADALDKSTVEQIFNPAEVEKQLVEEEKARLESYLQNEEEMSLMVIKLLTPKFRAAVDKLSSRSSKRVLKSLVEYPLHDYTHKEGDEQAAFTLGKSLGDAKMVLMYHTYNQNKDQIIEMALQDAAKNATVEYGNNEQQNEDERKVTNG